MPNPHDDQIEHRAENSAGEQAAAPKTAGALEVRFSRSDISVGWENGRYESLLDVAEEWNIDISSGCRYGDCGTCLTQILEGAVVYNHATGVEPDPGYCLPCSCRPLTSVTLNA
jgi:ferredoxin